MVVADEILTALIPMINFAKISAYGRDNVLELLIKFVPKKDGIGWHMKLIEAEGNFLIIWLLYKFYGYCINCMVIV